MISRKYQLVNLLITLENRNHITGIQQQLKRSKQRTWSVITPPLTIPQHNTVYIISLEVSVSDSAYILVNECWGLVEMSDGNENGVIAAARIKRAISLVSMRIHT